MYTITNCEGLSGSAWRETYATEEEATEALRVAMRWEQIVLGERVGVASTSREGPQDARCAYPSEGDMQADEEGAHAPRVVRARR